LQWNAAPAGFYVDPGGEAPFEPIENVPHITRDWQKWKTRIAKPLNWRDLFQMAQEKITKLAL
jgi:hypothetical protein